MPCLFPPINDGIGITNLSKTVSMTVITLRKGWASTGMNNVAGAAGDVPENEAYQLHSKSDRWPDDVSVQ